MTTLYKRGFCKECNKDVKVVANGLNHVLHLFLTMFSFGLWAPIWLVLAVWAKNWRCDECGSNRLRMFSVR